MKLHTMAFANVAAIVTAVLFTICALLIALWPARAFPFFSYLLHVDLVPSIYTMSWSVYFGGLAVWVVLMWLTTAGFAGLYNALARSQSQHRTSAASGTHD
jgi:hypothetical protein